MENKNIIFVDGREVEFNQERNLLEVIRNSGVDIPTFCYHSELSIYGACRLCLVDIEGRGLQASCSIKPEAGLRVKTNTSEIREIRKTNVELLLANHDQHCTTCEKSGHCQLQNLSRRLGITDIRFKKAGELKKIDISSPSLIRDPNKCVLCGDCVRFCSEVQGIGAIDFAFRGAKSTVVPAFSKCLDDVDCVNCGQCARVCPTGALVPKPDINEVWKELDNKNKTVVAQIAPAVRVAIGEYFDLPEGAITTGQIVSALKRLGFSKVYDTSFAADLTVIEEANEFIGRFSRNEKLPQFTSCCPAWVKFAEQYYPELSNNLSTCRSPQQMFGSVAKQILPNELNVDKKDLVVVSIMPCTAKKFEAQRPEFAEENIRDVDYVLTTMELGKMIEQAGICFLDLPAESLDLPFGFKTGAGIIFGATGGVTEAALRYAAEKVNGTKLDKCDFTATRGLIPIKEVEVDLDGKKVKMAVAYGLAAAKELAEKAKNGESEYAFIEIMACPGGCVNGAGQPVTYSKDTILERSKSLYSIDKSLDLHKSQDNPYVAEIYTKLIGDVNGVKAHSLLHTHYVSRRRISRSGIELVNGKRGNKVEIGVCLGTSCFVKGSQDLLRRLLHHVEECELQEYVDVKATFCFEGCKKAPVVKVGDTLINDSTFEKVCEQLEKELIRPSLISEMETA